MANTMNVAKIPITIFFGFWFILNLTSKIQITNHLQLLENTYLSFICKI